jgi:cell division protein FtsB
MFSRLRRFTPIALTLLILVLLFFTVTGSHGAIRLWGMGHELQALETRNRELETQITDLTNKITALERSEFELERTAREGLGLARPDETVYLFHGQESAGGSGSRGGEPSESAAAGRVGAPNMARGTTDHPRGAQ